MIRVLATQIGALYACTLALGVSVRAQASGDAIDDAVAQLMASAPPLPMVGRMREGDAAVMYMDSWMQTIQPGVEASADVVEGGDEQPMALHTRTWIRPTAIDELRKARRSAPSTAKEPCIEVGRITVSARDTPPTFFRFKAKFEEPPVVIAMLQEQPTWQCRPACTSSQTATW